jgi:UDP-2,3-diacylglucosamine pyrophosphatase LpxH
MIIYACSDLHVTPDRFSERAKAFLKEAAEREADYTLLCGDIFEGTHLGLKESLLSQNGKDLLRLIVEQKKPILILGNHDWTLRQVLADSEVSEDQEIQSLLQAKALEVCQNRKIALDDTTLYATHGWAEYDRPYGWMAPIYHRIVPLLASASNIMNWSSPSRLKARSQKKESRMKGFWERYYLRRERRMSTRAIIAARKHGYIPIWGHTHRRHIDYYEGWRAICCGDFTEDEMGGIVIEDGEVKLWEPTRHVTVYALPRG